MDISLWERAIIQHLLRPLEPGIMKMIDESGYVKKHETVYVGPSKFEIRGQGKNPFAVPHISRTSRKL